MVVNADPVLIVGAGVAGGVVADILNQNISNEYAPVGFVDDDTDKQGLVLHGLPVLGTRREIPELVSRYDVRQIIIAIPSAPVRVIYSLVDICQQSKVRLKILPRFYDVITGKVKTSQIRAVEVNDLLDREPVSLNVELIAGFLKGQVVLVTGAGGTIGSELCRQMAGFAPGRLILLGRGESSIYTTELGLKEQFPHLEICPVIGDIRDLARMRRVFHEHRPRFVFHTAAHKHVPYMELCPDEAIKNNILGTKNVAEVAYSAGTGTFVLVSSDKAVNPSSVMGATKRVAEMMVQNMNRRDGTRFVAVRFGNVLGSRGSVVPLFTRQISRGGPVTITHPEMVRYFMTSTEAAQLVIQAGVQARGGEIFILDMGRPVKVLELARKLIQLSGFAPEKDISLIFTGIRPGEKLVEQLVGEEETIHPTFHRRIFTVTKLDHDYAPVERLLQKIEEPGFSFNDSEVIALLQRVFPHFKQQRRE